VFVQAGNLVQAGAAQPLVTIQQIRPIKVAFSVPQENLSSLLSPGDSGLPVQATPPGGRAAQGRVAFVENAVDPQTGTVLLRAAFDNADGALWPGESVDVVLTLGRRANAVVAPASAVQRGQSGAFVYVVKADRTVESRPVKVLSSDAQQAVIGGGLSPGETVVTDGQLRLVPGASVQVREGA
jgi:multidrug efflux system membrane fusion protein